MEEETRRAVEGAIIAAHLKLAHKIIEVAIRDAKRRPGEAECFLFSDGFLWLLWLIGIEPDDLEDLASLIAMQAFGL